jgi:ubiquinone/menaquinone biosynthesis C-methylase UbiE
VFGVEYDQALVNIAQKKLFCPERIQRGDIRNLPYPDRMFDIIIDTSTLDHIQPSEVEQALREYNRTLKPGGRLLLIVWTKTLQDPPFIDNWTPSHQSFFNQERLLHLVCKYFRILTGPEILHTLHPDRELWQFKLEKKEGIVEDD